MVTGVKRVTVKIVPHGRMVVKTVTVINRGRRMVKTVTVEKCGKNGDSSETWHGKNSAMS